MAALTLADHEAQMPDCDDPDCEFHHPPKPIRYLSRMLVCWKCDKPVHDADMVEYYKIDMATGTEYDNKIGHRWCTDEELT